MPTYFFSLSGNSTSYAQYTIWKLFIRSVLCITSRVSNRAGRNSVFRISVTFWAFPSVFRFPEKNNFKNFRPSVFRPGRIGFPSIPDCDGVLSNFLYTIFPLKYAPSSEWHLCAYVWWWDVPRKSAMWAFREKVQCGRSAKKCNEFVKIQTAFCPKRTDCPNFWWTF
jgi:hypothetical protein